MKCKFCHNAIDRIVWVLDIDENNIELVINKISESAHLKGISLLGGDPLEYDYITKICNSLDSYKIPYDFITAGENIYTGKFDDIFKRKYCNFVGLSIDSIKENTVTYIRRKNVLNKQLQSLEHLLKIRQQNPNLRIHTNTILMNVNKLEILDTITFFSSKEVDKIQILGYQNKQHSKDKFNITFSEELEFVYGLSKLLNTDVNLFSKTDLELCFLNEIGKNYLDSLITNDTKINYGNSNVYPIFRESLFVSNDGFIYPCDAYKPYFEIDKSSNEPTKIYHIENLHDKSIDTFYTENEFFFDKKKIKESNNLYMNWKPCNNCTHLMNNCFPCLLNEVKNKTNNVLIEKYQKYKISLDS